MNNSRKVLAGTLKPDQHRTQQVRFVYGGVSEVDVGRVVSLNDAWQKGSATWAAGRRVAFANDPLNLLSMRPGVTQSVGLRCPAPPRQASHDIDESAAPCFSRASLKRDLQVSAQIHDPRRRLSS